MGKGTPEPTDGQVVMQATLRGHISFALSVLLPFGGVSLKALRLHLEWKLGSGLKDRKLEIRRLAELSLQQIQPILCAGDWEPIPCGSHVADRGRCLFSDVSDLQADGQWHDRLVIGNTCCNHLGCDCWELFCFEHGIQPDGKMPSDGLIGGEDSDSAVLACCSETGTGRHGHCCSMVGFEPAVASEARRQTSDRILENIEAVRACRATGRVKRFSTDFAADVDESPACYWCFDPGGVRLDVEAFGVDNVKATIQDGHMASAIMNAAIQAFEILRGFHPEVRGDPAAAVRGEPKRICGGPVGELDEAVLVPNFLAPLQDRKLSKLIRNGLGPRVFGAAPPRKLEPMMTSKRSEEAAKSLIEL
ncbi:Tubulin alpha chain [Symbiodinium microadriaticum]|uniref:Tubulin alpha chain n=1 Tax=Symbiodinium microadriaticum TaxID=2951 RepID=A0A1Q9ER30_SYMMI|nr:Tubulin alpha chain [Symbiodinium microadriaticum]